MADSIPRFGASDFWLVQTDAVQLREQLRSALEAVLGRPVVDADPHMVLASAFLPFLVQGQASADAAAKATLRAFAVGQDLDRIADSTCVVGYLNRRGAQQAILAYWVRVTVSRESADFTGTALISCELTREVVLSDTESVIFSGRGEFEIVFSPGVLSQELTLPVYALCAEGGQEYDGMLPITGDSPELDEDASVSLAVSDDFTAGDPAAYRCGASYNGTAAESDAVFAQRVAWQAKALRVPGSLEYFRLLLSELRLVTSAYVAPAVDSDGRIVMAWCDKCDLYARLNGVTLSARGAAYDEFYQAVRGSLLVEQRVFAYPALRDSTAYTVAYYLPSDTTDEASGRTEVERAWRAYLSEHTWRCGAIIARTDIDAILRGAGASRVDISTIAPAYKVLPADAIVMESAFTLEYKGLSTDSAAPEGAGGEEIAP